METVYLSRRNLLSLMSKLERQRNGEHTNCMIIKRDNVHPKYPQTMPAIAVVVVEDDDYYSGRDPGPIHPKDDPDQEVQ